MKEKQMKDLAWNTFKQTGNIHTFMEFMEMKNIEKNLTQQDTFMNKKDSTNYEINQTIEIKRKE